MKKIILIGFLFCSLFITAQNDQGKLDDLGRIVLRTYVPEGELPAATYRYLENKLTQIATNNGVGGFSFNQRFIITANPVISTKEIVPTTPAKHAITLDLTFYIGDAIDGTLFASHAVRVKGVGDNEAKAYNAAFKNINVNDPKLKDFLEQGKKKIIEYYNTQCDFIIKSAETLADQNQFDEAIFRLVTIPDVAKDCYFKAMDIVLPMYQRKIDRECEMRLSTARNIWSANQDINAANDIAVLLAPIEPSSSCYQDVAAFSNIVGKRVFELDQREWNFMLKVQQDDVDIKKQAIDAAKEVGVAYGNNQPNTVYNVKGWW